ncbi:hypothetical protein COLO4_05928 [Corchorus olitorius]|uniref:CCHC-type domain-containing protein n=1 Tax=Corchorus olitorius TaxID=93759 RepID=A0A1R3KPG3_9ROSI|nr:hypothetical protein COLO4_05928 [Corchorus olitorius]
MKIEGVIEERRLKRRFSPLIKPLIQAIKATDQLPEFLNSIKTLKPAISKMNPPNPPYTSRIRLMRECSWTDSDTSPNESGNSAQSRYGLNPAPIPELRRRRSHVYSFSSEQLEERRNEGYECLVGFLLDYRRFSTDFVQRYINREWELRGNATVIGREGNRFLIHYDREIDRIVGVIANPWAIDGAIIVLQPWNPNVLLSQARLLRVNLWLQIWDLPFEYQQPFIARTMAQSAGLVLQVDWENRRPRNIRFMRTRVSVDLSAPLVPGCTLEMDDGTTQWVRFRYERIQKFCLNCGEIGHNYRHCSSTFEEVEERIMANLNQTSRTYGVPIVVERDTPHFSNQMRAYLTRASRRNTSIGYRQVSRSQITDEQARGAENNYQEQNEVGLGRLELNEGAQAQTGPLGTREMEEEAPQQSQGEMQGQSQEPETTSNTPQNQEIATPRIEEDIQGEEEVERIEGHIMEQQQQHTANEREEETRRERQRLQQNQLKTMVPGARSQHGVAISAERIIEMTREMTDVVPQVAASVVEEFNQSLDVRIAALQDQLAHLTQRHPNQPSSFLEEFNGNYQYPQSPVEDPMREFNNSLERVQSIYLRHEDGFQNASDYEDMLFALAREQSRFEHICQEVVRQSTNLLSGLQMRDLNNPHTQSCQPRWINLPEGGATFTNANLVREEEHGAKNSAMGERRNQGGEFHRSEDMGFHLELIVNGEQQENLRLIGNSYYNLQVQDYTNNLHSIPEVVEDQSDAYKEAEVEIKSPAYRCIVNEEDMVSVFLKDSPTDEGAQRHNKELEESEKKK